ncbi:DUF952 domain-containing protein [Plantactinospora sp. GCM10030261]|uniref:DUF952 domain-containing protein n=1 Tax=Plantactinospora sp. GCM10030261 TaxID=3273420 RepID=UPI00361B4DAD
MIYKLLTVDEWDRAKVTGRYEGSADDLRDGYLHFSTAEQVVETAERVFAGQTGLTMLAVDPDRVHAELRWEPSRGGALFPHLYGPLPVAAVRAEYPLPADQPVGAAVAKALRQAEAHDR